MPSNLEYQLRNSIAISSTLILLIRTNHMGRLNISRSRRYTLPNEKKEWIFAEWISKPLEILLCLLLPVFLFADVPIGSSPHSLLCNIYFTFLKLHHNFPLSVLIPNSFKILLFFVNRYFGKSPTRRTKAPASPESLRGSLL